MRNDEPPGTDLRRLRSQIMELVARNAVSMVQNAIDAINEGGQYQALKYLFEIVGLYPPAVGEDQPDGDSLAATLLRSLGIEGSENDGDGRKSTPLHPLE